jgi:BirA family transcriptional regulator, biotin operon repressor / biotin---[acetyl-CoA-carboxylase] ligase
VSAASRLASTRLFSTLFSSLDFMLFWPKNQRPEEPGRGRHECLRHRAMKRPILRYAAVDSTMTIAATQPIGTVVVADEQTAGQGRHGHSWHSERDAGIYCSIVLEPAPLLTLALGLAAAEAITQTTGLACDLRWPNDVMINGKKVAGILVHLADAKAIAGIGINVNQTQFPEPLAHEATSLRLEAYREFSREDLLIALLRAVDGFIHEDQPTILRLFTHASSYAAGRRVTVQQPGGAIEGVTAGLDPSGFLIVRRDDGTDTLIVAGGVRAAGS